MFLFCGVFCGDKVNCNFFTSLIVFLSQGHRSWHIAEKVVSSACYDEWQSVPIYNRSRARRINCTKITISLR